MASETITRNDLTAILNSVLPNPTDMTPQEVEDFVDSLLGQGSNIADFVVEEGTETVSGIDWTYRKWNSGIAECWAIEIVHPNMNTPYGSSYIANLGDRSFPTGLFITVPKLCVDLAMAGGVGGACATRISTTTISIIYAYNFTLYNASAEDLPLSFDARGRWK